MPKSKRSLGGSGGQPQQQYVQQRRPSKKRLRVQSSGEEQQEEVEETAMAGRPGGSGSQRRRSRPQAVPGRSVGSQEAGGEKTKSELELRVKQKFRRLEAEKKKVEGKLVAKKAQFAAEREKTASFELKVNKLKKENVKLKKTNEKISKEKEESVKEAKEESAKLRKKLDGQKKKCEGLELERAKLESKLCSLNLDAGDAEAGPSKSAGPGLFQDMMDNFRELAETQLQCAVCNELYVEATTVNCGHTFCHYCITQWRKKKANCPVCRTDITQIVQCKVLDEYADKLYEQFVTEGGKVARANLKEERAKIKREQEAAAATRSQARRLRLERRQDPARVRDMFQQEEDDSSVDSDATLELHLSDSEQRNTAGLRRRASLLLSSDSESDSTVEFVAGADRSSSGLREILSESLWQSDTDSDDGDFVTSMSQLRARAGLDSDSASDSTDSDSSLTETDSTPVSSSEPESD